MPEPKETETEFGVAIPGRILPEGEWARTAIKRLPLDGPLDWKEIFGRDAPVVLELGCGNGRYTLISALARPELNHLAVDALPFRLGEGRVAEHVNREVECRVEVGREAMQAHVRAVPAAACRD